MPPAGSVHPYGDGARGSGAHPDAYDMESPCVVPTGHYRDLLSDAGGIASRAGWVVGLGEGMVVGLGWGDLGACACACVCVHIGMHMWT